MPKTTSGIDSKRPKAMSRVAPRAAAAMASTLSSDMIASAIVIVQTACQRLGAAAMSDVFASSVTSLTAIHSSARPLTIFR